MERGGDRPTLTPTLSSLWGYRQLHTLGYLICDGYTGPSLCGECNTRRLTHCPTVEILENSGSLFHFNFLKIFLKTIVKNFLLLYNELLWLL